MDKDITEQVEFGGIDEESLSLNRCVCGKEFDYWECILSNYNDMPTKCPQCGREMYFGVTIKVYEVCSEED